LKGLSKIYLNVRYFSNLTEQKKTTGNLTKYYYIMRISDLSQDNLVQSKFVLRFFELSSQNESRNVTTFKFEPEQRGRQTWGRHGHHHHRRRQPSSSSAVSLAAKFLCWFQWTTPLPLPSPSPSPSPSPRSVASFDKARMAINSPRKPPGQVHSRTFQFRLI